MSQTEQEHFTKVALFSAIQHCLAGTDSVEKLEIKWPITVFNLDTALHPRQSGSVEVIPQSLTGLSGVKYVFAEDQSAVFGQLTL